MITVEIGEKEYKLKVADTEEKRKRGLMGVKNLPSNEGMIFYFDKPQEVSFWMKDTLIPLDIIFVDDDDEVISVAKGQPETEDQHPEKNVAYVIELNQDSGVQEGDEVELPEDEEEDKEGVVMKVLAPDGTSQMDLKGGERIVSRKETKILLKKAKAAYQVKSKPDQYERKCKSLGKYMFKVLKGQDTRDPEYVKSPEE